MLRDSEFVELFVHFRKSSSKMPLNWRLNTVKQETGLSAIIESKIERKRKFNFF